VQDLPFCAQALLSSITFSPMRHVRQKMVSRHAANTVSRHPKGVGMLGTLLSGGFPGHELFIIPQ
jgi:hypothetical protein